MSNVLEFTETDTQTETETETDITSLKQEKEIEAWCAWLDRYRAVIKVKNVTSLTALRKHRDLTCLMLPSRSQWTLDSRLNLLDYPDHVTLHEKSPSPPMSTCGRIAIHSYAYGPAVYVLYLFLLFCSVLFCSVLYHITILLD